MNEYASSTVTGSGIGLTEDEKDVLAEFCKVLSKQTLEWLVKKWDLCPLLEKLEENPNSLSPRKILSRELMETRDVGSDEHVLEIDFTKMGFMDDWTPENEITLPDSWDATWNGNILQIHLN